MLFVIVYIITGILVFLGGLFYFLLVRPRRAYELSGSLDTILLRILLPQDEIPASGEAKHKEPKDIIISMEQFYASVESLRPSAWHALRFGAPSIALEIALPHIGEEVLFYVAIPRSYAAFITNQLRSFFPSARVEESEDYNIFHPSGVTAGTVVAQKRDVLLSLRTYQELGGDPLEVITGAFAKLKKEGDGAAIQCVIRPTQTARYTEGKSAAQEIRGGKSLAEVKGGIGRELIKFIFPEKPHDEKEKQKPGDEELAKQLEAKAASPAFDVNIRLMASASTPEEALTILQGLEAALLQFQNPQGNEFAFRRLGGKALEELVYHFSFRLFEQREAMYLCARELAGVIHFPYAGFSQPNVQYLKAKEAPPPVMLPDAGLRIGMSVFRDQTREVFVTDDDRRRHMYVIGQTGTGKSVFLQEMARQDIEAGQGVCFIDPHGDTVEALLQYVPKNRMDDVIYFNPGDVDRPMGLNFLEYNTRYPEQKSLIVNELLDIFNKLYNMSVAGGPMFEQYFRNATMLVMEDPQSGNTLLEVERVLVDKEFRDFKLSRSSNIVVEMFWKKIAEKAGGEASLQNMVPYITSKFDTFLANDIMRPIIAQEQSAFNFRSAMDEGKILLINLSKGRLGELNSALLGLIIVGKILIASLSRADIPEHERKDFFLYIDEFQNVTTKSIATILSEARKYRLGMIIAHQFLGQLDEDIKKAVFGNVGSIAAFRIGSDDGEFMAGQFSPVFTARDLLNIDNHNAYVKLLIHGETQRAFNIRTYPPATGNAFVKEHAIELSRLRYGRPREEIETAIRNRYHHA